MTSEVIDLIAALRNGTMTLQDVAESFRARSWPRRAAPSPISYLELATRAQQDPDPYIPDSFDDVDRAYQRGQISDDEYDVLVEAMSESMRAEDHRRRTGGNPSI
jgi:hypothetical protein